MIRAFKTISMGIELIVFAHSASKARYHTYSIVNNLHLGIEFRSITVKRAPEFDNSITKEEKDPIPGVCYLSGNLMDNLKETNETKQS